MCKELKWASYHQNSVWWILQCLIDRWIDQWTDRQTYFLCMYMYVAYFPDYDQQTDWATHWQNSLLELQFWRHCTSLGIDPARAWGSQNLCEISFTSSSSFIVYIVVQFIGYKSYSCYCAAYYGEFMDRGVPLPSNQQYMNISGDCKWLL